MMEQLEKVRKGLECCEKDVQLCYGENGCEYYRLAPRCWTTLAHDALALINAQQERIRELEDREKRFAEWAKRNSAHVCATCGRASHNRPHTTACPIEEHYAVPLDGGCHLWEERHADR